MSVGARVIFAPIDSWTPRRALREFSVVDLLDRRSARRIALFRLGMWFSNRSNKTFEELATELLHTKKARSKGTYSDANLYLTRLIRYFGKKPLADITEIDWGKYVGHCKAEKPKRKLHGDRKYMKQVMLAAFRQGITRNLIRLPIPDAAAEAGREITQAELTRLFAHANPILRLQMELALKTGMRLREMLYLEWDRINWQTQSIRLRPEDTKTRKGREVPLAPELYHVLRARYAQTKSRYVFPHRFDVNRPQHDNKTAWRRCKAKANVTTRWHDFRHTCATRLLRAGIPIPVVKNYCGMTTKILLRIYQHLNLDDLRKAALAMSESWKIPPTK